MASLLYFGVFIFIVSVLKNSKICQHLLCEVWWWCYQDVTLDDSRRLTNEATLHTSALEWTFHIVHFKFQESRVQGISSRVQGVSLSVQGVSSRVQG